MRSWKKLTGAALVLLGVAAGAEKAPSPLAPKPLTASAAPTPTIPRMAPALTKVDVDAWLDGFIPYALHSGDVAGAEIVVVKDGQILTARGYGFADVEKRIPVDPARTLFRPGSVSKLFTWTAVMQQVETGRLNLDADVNRYLDFRIPPRAGKPVTLRNLLTHTAGFEETSKDIMFYDPRHLMPLGTYLKERLPRRIYDPGTTPAYSNYGAALAGYIVERVSKESFEAYVERHILTPLGMSNSSFRQPLPPRLEAMTSKGYDRASDPPAGYELVGPAPAGAMAATGTDMARFMIAHLEDGSLDGKTILQSATVRMMHDTPLTLLPPLNRMELGFFETNINGSEVIAHLGDTQAFHSGLHLFLKEHVGIYISFNSLGKDAAGAVLRGTVFESFADRYFPATGPAEGRVDPKTSRRHAEMLSGVWENSRRQESNFMAALSLLGQAKVEVNGQGKLSMPLSHALNGKPRDWVEVAPFIWRDEGGYGHERLAVKMVDGKVVRLSIDGLAPFMVFDRAPVGRSSGWIKPAVELIALVYLVTLLLWPVRALVRRHFATPFAFSRRDLWSYRATRIAAAASLAVLAGWIAVFAAMTANIDNITSRMDGWLWLLQIGGWVILVGALAAMLYHAVTAWRAHRWSGKIWSAALVAASAILLWIAFSLRLLALTVNY